MKRLKVFLSLPVLVSFSILASSRAPVTALRQEQPELKIRIIPAKDTYVVNETVFVKTEFTNLSGKELCFPAPDQECINSVPGYLSYKVEGPNNAANGEQFLCQIDARISRSRKEIVSEIKKHWLKLLPGGTYTTALGEVQFTLTSPGQWRLASAYHPPEAAFGSPVQFRKNIESAAESVGCTVPSKTVESESTQVNVDSGKRGQ
jgi:hypothetical protein